MEEVKIKINEIFHSIQGESLLAGKPTAFIRTSYCNLRCSWCDTKYAYWEGALMTVSEILEKIKPFETQYACVTGGEPLSQRGTYELLEKLLKSEYTVSLETNGSFSIKDVPTEVIKVIDVKCPDSGESEKMAWENFALAQKHDQFKFVVASKTDFEWAQEVCAKNQLHDKCTILYSPAFGQVKPAELASWILNAKAPVTLQTQQHKEIWGPNERGT
ncbi:MAG: radical SAM protein [Deltaproteobacteria bacterium]